MKKSTYSKPLKKKKLIKKLKRIAIFNILLLLIYFSFVYIDRILEPSVEKTADIKARQIATKAIDEAVYREVSYLGASNKLINIQKDDTGKITTLTPDITNINLLMSRTESHIQKLLNSVGNEGIEVSLGNLTKNVLFANIGPSITIKMAPIGTSNISYHTEFTASGINQTKYTIFFHVKTKMQSYLPIVNASIEIEDTIPVAEKVIVGAVPNTYVNVPQSDDIHGYIANSKTVRPAS